MRRQELIEQVAMIDWQRRTPLGKTYSFDCRYYRLKDSPALPKPVMAERAFDERLTFPLIHLVGTTRTVG